MRKLFAGAVLAGGMLLGSVGMLAGPASAHQMDPPGNANGAPSALPMDLDNPGHHGVQCAAEGGDHPVFAPAGLFSCPAE